MYLKLCLIPVISAFIGYLTNVVAIKLLFWPHEPVNLVIWRIQGLLPKRQADIAVMIGEMVEGELLSIDDVINKINTPQMHRKIVDRLVVIINDRLNTIIPGIIPSKVKKIIMDSIHKILNQEVPGFINNALESDRDYIRREIQINKLVEAKINEFDLNNLESIVRKVSFTELRFIEIMGGVLGLIIGLIQVGILILFPL